MPPPAGFFPKFKPPKPAGSATSAPSPRPAGGDGARPSFPTRFSGGATGRPTIAKVVQAPPPPAPGAAKVAEDENLPQKTEEELLAEERKAKLNALLQAHQKEDDADQPEDKEEEEEKETLNIVKKLPVSVHGKIYFQTGLIDVQTGEPFNMNDEPFWNFAPVGLVVIDLNSYGCAQLYDCFGRQYGNKPDPGYDLRQQDMDKLSAGNIIRVGSKQIKLITAVAEEVFRTGEFFLRTEHESRRKEEKKREKEAMIPKKKKDIFLGDGFAKVEIRRRPRAGFSGFVVPVVGSRKSGGAFATAEAMFDHDREGAVVLFRADYKRDAQNRPICSVVVDPIIGDKLRPHQREGVQFLWKCLTGELKAGYYGAILADEMGLGKTIQTVATIWTCLKQGNYGQPLSRRCVVVAPSSLVKNWGNEFVKWLGEGKVKTHLIQESTPKGDRIISRFETEGDVLVISYDQLRKYIPRLKTITTIELVVCDEGHKLKNAEIKTTQAVASMPTKRRIILSGTPIQNDLSEFHAMVDFVNPGIVGENSLFRRVYQEPIMHGRNPDTEEEEKLLGQERAGYLALLTSKFILRRTQKINEKYLPAKVDATVFCGLGKDQRTAYENISMQSEAFSSTPLVLITALKKLCSHMDLLHEAIHGGGESTKAALPKSILPKGFKTGSLEPSSGSKMAFVGSMLDRLRNHCPERDKLVIVSNYTQTLNLIAKLCDHKKVAYFQLDGTTPIKKRQELVDQFNVPFGKELVFLLSSKAGGVGLNLIGANRLILFDPDWNPANDAQAMGRVWRDGQKKRVFIYRLLSTGTIEEKIYQRQVSKQGLSANVVDGEADSKQHFTADEMKALFVYKGNTACDTHDLLECKCQEERKKPSDDPTAFKFKKVIAKTGPRMDELRGWQHVGNAAKFELDKMLATMCTNDPRLVTFLFANERDTQKVTEEITVERAFKEDQGDGIVCNTQQDEMDLLGSHSQLEIAVHDEHSDDEEDY